MDESQKDASCSVPALLSKQDSPAKGLADATPI